MWVSRALGLAALTMAALGETALADGFVFEDGVGASAESSSESTAGRSLESEVVCNWGDSPAYYRTGRSSSGEYVYVFLDQNYWRLQPATGEVWVQTWRVCRRDGEVVSNTLAWRRVVGPDPRVLAESLYDEVVRQVPLPDPALSPVGPGFVNLGMWLAVVEPAPVSVTATAGSSWATTSAELESTTFDMGDGSVVVCAGAGDPIPPAQLDSLDPSPECGHTYTGVNGRRPFEITITSRWRVSWVGSGGAGGDLGTLDRSATLDYRVLEIQTVGD